MITESILDAVFGALSGLLSLLPDISWEVDGSAFDIFLDILEMVCYMLPMDTVGTIFGLIVSITIFRIIISIIKSLWELLPIV